MLTSTLDSSAPFESSLLNDFACFVFWFCSYNCMLGFVFDRRLCTFGSRFWPAF